MQIKAIVIASMIFLPLAALRAQPDRGNTEDTVTVLPKGVKSVSEPIASNAITTTTVATVNMPGTAAPMVAEPAAAPLSERELEDQDLLLHGVAAKKYKPVPLAGQKGYYGDKNEYVMDFVKKYFEAHNGTFSALQDRSAQPFSLMDNALKRNNIPKELKYLAVIESALNNNALSPVGAVGPWQFMSGTARNMGLTVSGRHDDRKDWLKSTNAAARYISLLYGKFQDWLLVVAAYNCGPVPVQRAIDKYGSRSFWDIKEHLPLETQGHVMKFIATATVFEQLQRFIGIGSMPQDFKFGEDTGPQAEVLAARAAAAHKKAANAAAEKKRAANPTPQFTPEELQNMAIVRITDPLSMEIVSKELTIDKHLLARWNPDYDLFLMKAYPTEYYKLRIPKDKVDNFVVKKELLTKRSAEMFSALVM